MRRGRLKESLRDATTAMSEENMVALGVKPFAVASCWVPHVWQLKVSHHPPPACEGLTVAAAAADPTE